MLAGASGGLSVFATPWSSDEEKEGITRFLRPQFKALGIVRYVLIFESWFVSRAPDAARFEGQVRDQPDRQEAVMAMGYSRDEENILASSIIHRAEDGT